ncbi:unnamed protein product [Closterium sp. Naga37s-1]|nr:unnamed protein product [Closterium sp. Naga37s-1]
MSVTSVVFLSNVKCLNLNFLPFCHLTFFQWGAKTLCFEFDTEPYALSRDGNIKVGCMAWDATSHPLTVGRKDAVGVKALCFEFDTEPYALAWDGKIKASMQEAGVRVVTPVSHTIFDPAEIIKKNGGKAPLTYQAFCKRIGQPSPPVGSAPDKLPPLPPHLAHCVTIKAERDPGPGGAAEEAGKCDYIEVFEVVPTLSELGYSDAESFPKEDVTPFRGGEAEALRRLDDCLARTKWVKEFEKPKGDPSALDPPATTVLSPYLKFGCLSSRPMYARIQEVLSKQPGHTKPPVSLIGQLLWREFFYTAAYGTPNFDRMQGSSICRQIPWKVDSELLAAWRDARTGFPWIDAIMMQLRQWGWMHHLARHCVACFLTRGDLSQRSHRLTAQLVHWELGRDVFDRLLLDADWAINNGNWLCLSASAFFSQYHRIYSPTTDLHYLVHWELGRDVYDRLLLDGDWAINNGNWFWLSPPSPCSTPPNPSILPTPAFTQLVHWELGRDVFDWVPLDADLAINNGNWLGLSASAFFSQYPHHCSASTRPSPIWAGRVTGCCAVVTHNTPPNPVPLPLSSPPLTWQLVHWELGRDVFDRLLVDSDWAINNGNWLWLSASAFFSQYHRIYSPITFGKKYDPLGKFIRHFLPVLKGMF